MTIKFKLVPRKNISLDKNHERWQITGLPAQLELRPQLFPLPVGWVLLEGVLHRSGQDYSAKLIAELGGVDQPYYFFPLPVSRKGTILELIYLPKNVLRLVLEPMQSYGQFQLTELSIKPIGYAERISRMINRVVPLFFKYSYQQRHHSGLKLYTPFINLHKAYQIAGRFRAYAASLTYHQWIEEFDLLSQRDRQLIHRQIKKWKKPPHFEIILHAADIDEIQLIQTIDSLQRQLFRHFRVTLLTTVTQNLELSLQPSWLVTLKLKEKFDLNKFALLHCDNTHQSTWIICLTPGTILADHALYWLAYEALQHKTASFIYTDHDLVNAEKKRIDPVFKPDWSLELLRSTNYIGCAGAIRSDVLLDLKNASLKLPQNHSFDYHDLFLHVVERLDNHNIRHIPAVLWHLPCEPGTNNITPQPSAKNPVAAHLKRIGICASVEQKTSEHFKVSYHLPEILPLISIIIPTRDTLNHLKTCVESIFKLTGYPNFEVLIIDNDSCEQATLDYLNVLTQRPKVRVLHYPHPFNYSSINNFAVAQANGEVLCLLNNDTEVISPDWLEEMLGHLLQKSVGAVGAKLYFSDGRVQHAGDTVGPGGCANHLHSMIGRNDPGYCNRAILAQDLSAVTGACLMTWRKLFLDLGGLDETNLPISFNDVDYCLRVREAGYRIIWTPYAELYHHESASRGKDDTPEKIKRAKNEVTYMRERWKHVMQHDPFYNLNLSYERPDFSLSNVPMVKKPWA